MCAEGAKKKTHDRSTCSYASYCSLLHFEIRLGFTERSYYPRKLVLVNARSGKTVPTRGSRAGPTTHPHSRIKHKCHLPMPDPHEPRARLLFSSFFFFFLSFQRPRSRLFFPRRALSSSRFETPELLLLHSLISALVAGSVTLSRRYFPADARFLDYADRRKRRRDLTTICRAKNMCVGGSLNLFVFAFICGNIGKNRFLTRHTPVHGTARPLSVICN